MVHYQSDKTSSDSLFGPCRLPHGPGALGHLLSLTVPGHVSLERTEVAVGATLLDGSAEGTQEPDERIPGSRKGNDLKEHCFVR